MAAVAEKLYADYPALDRAPDTGHDVTLEVRVVAARMEAESITSYELACPAGRALPEWAPGAHIDVHLPSGTIRQYSLCGNPQERGAYRIAVLELPAGRGGSVEVHREMRPGVRLEISRPRQNFALAKADRYVFVAGGIGITPLLPMIRQVQAEGKPWRLFYCARNRARVAFLAELDVLGDAKAVEVLTEDTTGRPDLDAIVKFSEGAALYTCGPTGLMDALSQKMTDAGRADEFHLERFAPAATPRGKAEGVFEVELKRQGVTIEVGPDESILEAIRSAGIEHQSSCEMGICGTCEARVISGEIDHRDDLLTDAEHAAGDVMMLCVSRAKSDRLVIDL